MDRRKMIAAGVMIFFLAMPCAWGAVYDICEGLSDETVSEDDFLSLFEAIVNEDCNEAVNVKMGYSLTEDDFFELAMEYEMLDSEDQPLVFFRTGTPDAMGIGAIMVYGNDGDFPVKIGDRIHIWRSGRPADIIIEVSIGGCDPYDNECDEMCAYEDEHVCDPMCYTTNLDGVQCDMDCVDINGNHEIDPGDIDGICDPDCYNDDIDPKNAYDPDCVAAGADGICDPDSQGVRDGVCDEDCAGQNRICDFDCDGKGGNPKDPDCYTCDGDCNGFCSYACSYHNHDPDCPEGFMDWFNLEECCGNDICGIEENCFMCTEDCPPDNGGTSTDCSIFNINTGDNFFCCPLAYNADQYGCADLEINKQEGEKCTCQPECETDLICGGPDGDKHCCPEGTMWNGSECAYGEVLIVALKSNLEDAYGGDIDQIEDKIDDLIDAMSVDGLGATFLYLDEDETADIAPGGVKVYTPENWTHIDSVLDVLIPKLNSKYLIIIGGYERFPQAWVGSDAGSDDPYASIDGDSNYVADIAVGRIPDPNDGNINVILNTINTAIKLHKEGGIELDTHVSPIMGSPSYGCGGFDSRDWNTGRCPCTEIWGDSPCDSVCGSLELSSTSGMDHVILLAHGPGPAKEDYLMGGNINAKPNDISSLDVSEALWMSMACGGAHLKLKDTLSDSIAMTFLNNGGGIFLGSSDLNYGSLGERIVTGGDCCIGSLYTEVANRLTVGNTIGQAYLGGKNAFYAYPSVKGCQCAGGHNYQYHINYLLGDPTIKIKSKW